MNDALKMQISAFIDDELPANECELLLLRLSQDAELRQLADQYYQIGRSMRQEADVGDIGNLRERIAEQLGEGIVVEAVAPAASTGSLLKPLAGFAIAASVALVAIFGLRQFATPEIEPVQVVVEQDAAISDPVLDEMFRYHDSAAGNGILTELVTLEFNEAELIKVEPNQGMLVQPGTTLDEEVEDDEADDQPESQELAE